MTRVSIRVLSLLMALPLLFIASVSHAASGPGCQPLATSGCYFSFQPAAHPGNMHYYASRLPDEPAGTEKPDSALIVLHGHPRDANITFDAALSAVDAAGAADSTVVVAPVFQVVADEVSRCSTPGVPAAQSSDLLWTCSSWMDGGEAENSQGMTSFAALDALVGEVSRRWPTVRRVTIAGFSAGAQMLQHYIGFAAFNVSSGVSVRYVVADPGTWLYFDSVRPAEDMDGQTGNRSNCADASCRVALSTPSASNTCLNINQWKYGIDKLPDVLKRTAVAARIRYASAEIDYLEAAEDGGTGRGTYSRILDKSCAAMAQGTFRLQRGLNYAAYDRQRIAPAKRRRVTIIPDCAHDVTCVFTSPAARAALIGPSLNP